MTHRKLLTVVILSVALICTTVGYAQTKAALKPLDINSATEDEIVAVGIDKAIAKKIVESRPYRNKAELVSRMLLTRAQYDKVKDALVARQPPRTAK